MKYNEELYKRMIKNEVESKDGGSNSSSKIV
jgi:hypothetical protein